RRRRRAAISSELAFTIRARLLESCPSLHSGKAPRRYSLASSSRTASPRNSRRSLSLGSTAATASSAPAERNSGTAELWVSALSRSSLAENLYPRRSSNAPSPNRSEEHTSELQSRFDLVCRLLLEKKKINTISYYSHFCQCCSSLSPSPIPPPPTSTLFPYTTLFRSLSLGSTAATASSAPAERNSGTAELWVSALSRSSLAENLYPRRSSNAPSPN